RVAAEALLGVDEPLGRLRGKVHERAGVSVVVTFALAYLLRNPTEKAKACSANRAFAPSAAFLRRPLPVGETRLPCPRHGELAGRRVAHDDRAGADRG